MPPLLPLVLAASLLPAQEAPQPLPGRVTEELDPAVLQALAGADPSVDGWNSEVLLPAVEAALRDLEAALEGAPGAAEVEVVPDPGKLQLVPAGLRALHDEGALRVWTADPAVEAPGPGTLEEALAALNERLGSGPRRAAWKVLAVAPEEDLVRAEVLGALSTPRVEVHAAWRPAWLLDEDGRLRLAELVVDHYVEARREGTEPIFADATADLLRAEPAWRDQLALGIEHWRRELDASLGVSTLGHQGLAVGDVDGDRVEEVYLLQPGGLPNRLLVRTPDGRAVDRAREAGLDFLDPSRSALFLDLDGDRDQDLALALFAEVLVLENDGGTFTVRGSLPAPTATSIAAADYDLDGRLDLYVCGYVAPYDDEVSPIPYHDANNGEENHLYRNLGGWEFDDVTEAVGLDEGNRRFSFAASWEDLDADGDPDLYVANDFGRNNLYRNDGGTFTDVAAEAGVEDLSAGMGVTYSDFDRNGWFDVHVSNMFSSAGHRMTYARRFQEEASPSTRSAFRRHARGNSLFANEGDLDFVDVSVDAGITVGRWAWGSLFTDFDNDGLEDLYVPNGFVTSSRRADDL